MEGPKVKHLRQILLWPVHLLPLNDDSPVQDHFDQMSNCGPVNPWFEIDDEFGDPGEFQARHYNEFVTFLPPAQRFLYGQGLGRRVGKGYGESPIRVLRRKDIARARVTLDQGEEPLLLEVAHVDLYFFFDIDVIILVPEVYCEDIELSRAQELMFRFGRAYPAYWEKSGRGGHCPWKVEWLSPGGEVVAASDYERREKFLSFVCQHRAPITAAHWDALLAPIVLHHGDKAGDLRYRQLEYYRMPYMAFLALESEAKLERADYIRLALGNGPGEQASLPYSESYLEDFERRYYYDRYFQGGASEGTTGARFLAGGNTLVVVGSSAEPFFVDIENGLLARFRHQHFLLFLIAHFQKAALRMFSDRLVWAVTRLDVRDAKANRIFRRDIRFAHQNFLRFSHRYWLHEISNQAQTRELFEMTRSKLNVDALYNEVRNELRDMDDFLDEEAARKQNEIIIRLTVVTILSLVGTLTTGFLGMNLFSHADLSSLQKLWIFLAVLLPTIAVTLYIVMKSSRLSDFLDALSDEQRSWSNRWQAFKRVWSRK